jgi:hypothetical protein
MAVINLVLQMSLCVFRAPLKTMTVMMQKTNQYGDYNTLGQMLDVLRFSLDQDLKEVMKRLRMLGKIISARESLTKSTKKIKPI